MTSQIGVAGRARSIPFCEPWLSERYADAVKAQVLSGWVGPGQQTTRFQETIARQAGSRYGVFTTSGTIALSVAAKAAGLQMEDEIVVPAYGVISTIHAFASFGFSPRLVDIDRATGCLSLTDLEATIGPKTKAVCFVNFSGYTGSNVIEIRRRCEQRGLILIEDAACAFGQRYEGRFAGTFGHLGTYSFSVPKIITTGQGGAIVTDSDEYYERAAAFIDHGDTEWRRTNVNRGVGTNLRATDIQAALGLAQLQDLDSRLSRKRAVYQVLKRRLGQALFQIPGDESPLHYIVFTSDREQLLVHLQDQGIQATVQYRTLCEHPPYAYLGERAFPNADFWSRHAVYLPFGLALEPVDAERIAHAVLTAGVDLLTLG